MIFKGKEISAMSDAELISAHTAMQDMIDRRAKRLSEHWVNKPVSFDKKFKRGTENKAFDDLRQQVTDEIEKRKL